MKRFKAEFGPSDEDQDLSKKPADFQHYFQGNADDCFRLGIKFTRSTVKLFSAFSNSDIIVASPLGLKLAMTNKKGEADCDFLSSIEILVVDHANALAAQNWEHFEEVMKNLNKLPKENHECDFLRLRPFYGAGLANRVRQTIILSEFSLPELDRLFLKQCNSKWLT